MKKASIYSAIIKLSFVAPSFPEVHGELVLAHPPELQEECVRVVHVNQLEVLHRGLTIMSHGELVLAHPSNVCQLEALDSE